jgi:membrane fusion protein (multidrug efflux system)
MTEGLFRAQALAHHAGGEPEGDVLRFERAWPRVVYRLIAAAALAAFLFASLFSVDQYASGPAVVRVDGRQLVTATAPGTVESVLVRPGQLVEAGAVLVRMHDAEEQAELARATREFDMELVRMLRDPNDPAVKEAIAGLRAARDQAKNAVLARTVRAESGGWVSDVRVHPGQHAGEGEVLVAVAPRDGARVSLVAMIPAEYRPLLRTGQSVRFELDGFRYEYADLTATDVSAEAVGPGDVQRFLGDEGAVALEPGAKVLVSAALPLPTFTSEGHPYGYFDGMTGTAAVRVRRETILLTLLPALRQWRLLRGGPR